jgi:hypothetical protein
MNPPHSMLIGLCPMVRAFVALDARPAAERLMAYFMRFVGENPRYRAPLLCAQSVLCGDPATARALLNEAEEVALRLELTAELSRIRNLKAAATDADGPAQTDLAG